MRIKCVYSCSIKIHASGFNKLLEIFFFFFLRSACCGAFFPAISCQDVWRSGSQWEVRWRWRMSQNFIANSVNFWNVNCATCSWALSWRIGHFLLTMPASGTAIFGTSHRFVSTFLRGNGFVRIQKVVVDQMGSSNNYSYTASSEGLLGQRFASGIALSSPVDPVTWDRWISSLRTQGLRNLTRVFKPEAKEL